MNALKLFCTSVEAKNITIWNVLSGLESTQYKHRIRRI